MITHIKYGNTNTYLIRGNKGNLLIDTDYAGTMQGFYREIKAQDIKVSDITYILATHYHPDHIGLASELMEQGVKLVIMEPQSYIDAYADNQALKADWEKILSFHPRRICHAHANEVLL